MNGVFPDRRLANETTEPPRLMAWDEHSRAFLASIVESSEDSIIGTNLEGVIASWNHGAERLWGYTAAEALGRRITMLFPPDKSSDYLRSVERIRHEERIER